VTAKPVIRWDSERDCWLCGIRGALSAAADTPVEAYYRWSCRHLEFGWS